MNDHSRTAEHLNHHRDLQIARLIRRLPESVQKTVKWLRQPSARWVRIPAAILLVCGSFLFILPVFGLWMLPFGLVLLSEDIPALRRLTDRMLNWIELRRPHWMGLPEAPSPSSSDPNRN